VRVWQLNCRTYKKLLQDHGEEAFLVEEFCNELRERRIQVVCLQETRHDTTGYKRLKAAFQTAGYFMGCSARECGKHTEGCEWNKEVGTLVAYNPRYAETRHWGQDLDGWDWGHNWCSLRFRSGKGPRLVVVSAYVRRAEQEKPGDEKPLLEYVEKRLRMEDSIMVVGDLNEDFRDRRQRVGGGLLRLGLKRVESPGTTRGIRKEERSTAKANQAIWVSPVFADGNLDVLTHLGEEWSDYHIPVQFTCEVEDERMGGARYQ
jgi:hypothetical protein